MAEIGAIDEPESVLNCGVTAIGDCCTGPDTLRLLTFMFLTSDIYTDHSAAREYNKGRNLDFIPC